MRITRGLIKAGYVIGGWVTVVVLGVFTGNPIVDPLIGAVIHIVAYVAFLTIAVRSFRGYGEPVAPPRRWWRATARPTSGFVIGVVYVLTPLALYVGDRPLTVADLIEFWAPWIFGVYFLHSSVRLVLSPGLVPPKKPRDVEPGMSDYMASMREPGQ